MGTGRIRKARAAAAITLAVARYAREQGHPLAPRRLVIAALVAGAGLVLSVAGGLAVAVL